MYSPRSLVMREKDESQSGGNKKAKHAKYSEKRTFLTPLMHTRTYAYLGVRNICFSKNLACFTFLLPPL